MEDKEPNQAQELFRTNFNNLFDLVKNGRVVDAAYLSGSVPPPSDGIWRYLANMGIKVQVLNKAADGKEQESADMSLQTMILRTAMDNIDNPSVIAVLTGDGAGKQLGEGFLSDLQRVKKFGWDIELYAWNKTCNRYLRDYVSQNGKFVALESYYDSITFLKEDRYNPTGKQVRPSTPLQLN